MKAIVNTAPSRLERYHSPADDLKQPWDPEAAARFNDFFHKLVVTLANAPEHPHNRSR